MQEVQGKPVRSIDEQDTLDSVPPTQSPPKRGWPHQTPSSRPAPTPTTTQQVDNNNTTTDNNQIELEEVEEVKKPQPIRKYSRNRYRRREEMLEDENNSHAPPPPTTTTSVNKPFIPPTLPQSPLQPKGTNEYGDEMY